MRSRGESATTVITAESMAEQYGVTQGTYEAVALPRTNVLVVSGFVKLPPHEAVIQIPWPVP
jgi:hypothetical protein